MTRNPSRRKFLQTGSLAFAAAATCRPVRWASAQDASAAGQRPKVGCIGNGGMGGGDARNVSRFGDIVALSDVDRQRAETLNGKVCQGQATIYEDYRRLLDRQDIQIVTISTPDHWHTKIAIDAMRAGKDIYCQKPLTLTIDEGKKIINVLRETQRVFQVGTQQRSENNSMFLKAVAMVQSGRIGKVQRVTCAIGGAPSGGPFAKAEPPTHLNWERWLGQAPLVDYIPQRCHGSFRWWYEYSGGKMTDWGAHHVDIAQWAIGMDESGPLSIEPVSVSHPVPLQNGMPTQDDCFNTATEFVVRCMFPDGVEMIISHDLLPDQKDAETRQSRKKENGILFEGESGRFFVNRGKLVGKPVEDLVTHPLPEDALVKLRKGKPLGSHMENFILCVQDRSLPVSDVYTHHRSMTTCHLANIALRLGRTITWDPAREIIVGDEAANSWLSRPQRKGYEI